MLTPGIVVLSSSPGRREATPVQVSGDGDPRAVLPHVAGSLLVDTLR